MPGATPIYLFPYPTLIDPPNGAANIQSLATAVEGKFVTSDAAILAIQNNANMQTRIAAQTSDQAITSLADLSGNTLTFSTTRANVKVLIWGFLDVSTSGVFEAQCVVDAGVLPNKIHLTPPSGTMRATGSQMWTATLATIGSHNIKLQATNLSGSGTVYGTHSTLTVLQLAL